MTPTNLQTLKAEFLFRANAINLEVDCPSDGVFNAEIAIVGEAPGYNEVSQKKPFVGGSGQYLWGKLRPHGITRVNTFATNVVKRHIALDLETLKGFRNDELASWKDMLLWELSQLPNLRYVLAMGNYALRCLCNHKGIDNWRGSVLPITLPNGRTVQVVTTYNPAMILRQPKTEISFLFDLAKFKKVTDNKWQPKEIKTEYNIPYKEAMYRIAILHGQALKDGTPIAFDYEVVSNETACIGLANSSTQAYCFNFRTKDKDLYTVEEERNIRKRMQRMFIDKNVKFIAQNGMFDTTWGWYKDKIRPHAIWFDTMLAHHTLYPTLPHNLGYITTQYTMHPYYKDEKDEWREDGDIDSFWNYNGKDCCNTFEAAMRMLEELRGQNLDKFFFDHVMKLQPHLARMTVGGVLMDMNLKQQIKEQLAEDVAKKLAEFHTAVSEATGTDELVNPNSPSQLAKLFFNDLKLVGRGSSTDAANRKRMLDNPRTSDKAKNVINKLEAYVVDNKFLSTYAEMEIDPDNRARCEYKQTGVQNAPGRLSSSKTLWGSGMNLQNQPFRARPMFIADPGFVFCYFDMAQAEARLVAWDAKIASWQADFERARIDGSYDAHRALAATMFRIPYDDVPTYDEDNHGNKSLRYIAKRCRHGLNYRMQAARLAQTTGLSLAQATDAFNRYHRETPELKRWWFEKEQEVRKTKTLFNAYGRRLMILERLTDEALESIVAFFPQSTLGDHVCRVIYKSEQDPKWPSNARVTLNIHDALIAIAKQDDAKRVLSIMKKYAEEPIIVKGQPLIIPADVKMSVADEQGIHRWSNLKKVEL